MNDALYANREKLLTVITTPGLTSFSSNKLYVVFLFITTFSALKGMLSLKISSIIFLFIKSKRANVA